MEETEYIDVTPTEESEEEIETSEFPWKALMASAVAGATSTVIAQQIMKRRRNKKIASAAASAEEKVTVITTLPTPNPTA
jgi:hypothetical protein